MSDGGGVGSRTHISDAGNEPAEAKPSLVPRTVPLDYTVNRYLVQVLNANMRPIPMGPTLREHLISSSLRRGGVATFTSNKEMDASAHFLELNSTINTTSTSRNLSGNLNLILNFLSHH